MIYRTGENLFHQIFLQYKVTGLSEFLISENLYSVYTVYMYIHV